MKKYLAMFAIVGFFVALPTHAQTTGVQNQSALQATLNALRAQLSQLYSQLPAAAITSATVKTDSPIPTIMPVTAPGNCGQTLTPIGKTNETIRCDGRNWVAASNLLNDGNGVGIGEAPESPQVKLKVVNNQGGYGIISSINGTKSAIYASNQGAGPAIIAESRKQAGVTGISYADGLNNIETPAVGVRGIANGIKGKGVFGTSGDPGGVGVVGMGQNGAVGVRGYSEQASSFQTSGMGVMGEGYIGVLGAAGHQGGNLTNSVGVKAVSYNSYGFYQEGAEAKNNLEGSLTVGYQNASTPASQVKIKTSGGIQIDTVVDQPYPGCTDATRGTFWFVKSSVGVKDTVQVCAKDAAGTYAWRTLY